MAYLSSDKEILDAALQWQRQGERPLLITVLRTWGSAPRPPGSLLALCANGHHAGSVSGGCVEDDLFMRCKNGEWHDLQKPQRIYYGIEADEAARFGLPCGGQLELLIENLEPLAHWESVYERMSHSQIQRCLQLESGQVELVSADHNTPALLADDQKLAKVFGPQWRMLLIGANHLAQSVAQFALALNYQVVVCDPRKDYYQQWDVKGADVLRDMPDDSVRALAHYERTIVLALTHDPKLDDMALMEALLTDAFYVGALGSKATSLQRRERMRLLEVPDECVARLKAPVGLPIGSHTPAEIALSIMADITAQRNGIRLVKACC